jgi:hypothetical protein
VSIAASLLRRFVPARLGHAEAFGHQLRQARIAGHAGHLFLPEIEVAGGEPLEIGRFGAVGHGMEL